MDARPGAGAARARADVVEVSPARPPLDETLDVGFLRWVRIHRWRVFVCVLLLYAAAFNGQWRITSDSVAYVNWAHRIADGAHVVVSEVPSHFYAGLPWLIGATFRVFHTDNLFTAQLAMLGLGLVGLGLTYALMRRRAGAGAALMVVFLMAVNHTYFIQSYRLLADLPLAIGLLLLLLGWEWIRPAATASASGGAGDLPGETVAGSDIAATGDWWAVARAAGGWACVVAGAVLMLAMKRAAWVLLAAVLIFLIFQAIRGGQWRRYFAAGLLLLAGVFLFILLDPRQPGVPAASVYLSDAMPWGRADFGAVAQKVLYESLPRFFSEVAASTGFGLEFGPGLDETLGLVPFLAVLALGRRAPLWVVLVVVYGAACAAKGASPRYFVPILPIIAFGWWNLAATLARWKPATVGPYLFWACLGLWVIPNMVKNVDLLIEQRRTPFLAHYESGRYAGLERLGRWARAHLEPDAVLLGPYPKALAHFSGRRVIGEPALLDRVAQSDGFAAALRVGLLGERGAIEWSGFVNADERIEGLGDFDGDGDADLLWRSERTGRIGIRWLEAGAVVGEADLGEAALDPGWEIRGVGDLTADGVADVVWRHTQTGENAVWRIRGDGAGRERLYLRPEPATGWGLHGAGDFDGDGMVDLLWRGERTGGTNVWLMDRRRKAGVLGMARVEDLRWEVAGVFAPVGDDAAAVIWGYRGTGERVVWLMRGRARVATLRLPSPGAGWRVVGVADLSGDGAVDLLWRHRPSGRYMLWRRRSEVYVVAENRTAVGRDRGANRVVIGPSLTDVNRGEDERRWTLHRVSWAVTPAARPRMKE